MDYKPNGSKTILIDLTKKYFDQIECFCQSMTPTGLIQLECYQTIPDLFKMVLNFEKKCTKLTKWSFTEQTLTTIKLIFSDWNVDVITFIVVGRS